MAKRRSRDEEEAVDWVGAAMIDSTELERRRAKLLEGGPRERAAASSLSFGRTALVMSGEIGYQQVRVEALIVRAGSNRARFYDAFADKEACFTWAYRAAAETLCERLLRSCAEAGDWASGMRAGLVALAAFVSTEPEAARGLLAEPGGASAAVAAKREEVVERLSLAVDRGRRERIAPGHEIPAATARFVLGAIESAILKFLSDPGRDGFQEELPDLLYLAVELYLGSDAARSEVKALGSESGAA
jgi:AcrR family transcriptional regulator